MTVPRIPLANVLKEVVRPVELATGVSYRSVGVKWYGAGVHIHEERQGHEFDAARFQIRADDVIYNDMWARKGSVAVVPVALSGAVASSHFPTFEIDTAAALPKYLSWYFRTSDFWSDCELASRGSTGRNQIKRRTFLSIRVPLPPVSEQRRIVERIERIAGSVEEARRLRGGAEQEVQVLLAQAFWSVSREAPRQEMSQVAPLMRRPVEVQADGKYPELGIRSFGKGTFHKPAISGLEVGTKRLFRIEPGDLLFSNVFAWEGAIAVARPEDRGRCGSHRFITCVCTPDVAIAEYLRFYFLTSEGLAVISEASPGGAGRNRTLGIEALGKIPVPIPRIELQRWFSDLVQHVRRQTDVRLTSTAELDAVIPAVLDRAFRGEM
jgi:type I restriction enzyme S subunit